MSSVDIIAFDCETHLIRPGLLAPPMVCTTFAEPDRERAIRTADHPTLEEELGMVFDDCDVILGANTAFDAAVVLARFPRLAPSIFRAYAEGRVLDVQLIEKLSDIARGRLRGYADGHGKWHPLSYSLAVLVRKYLGKDRTPEKVDPMGWRMRYAELDGVPLHQWPQPAIDYAIEDATDTLDVYRAQLADRGLWEADIAAQCRAHFALHLLSCWGFQTDARAIDELEGLTKGRFEELTEALQAEGLIRANGTRDTKKAKQRIVDAFLARGLAHPTTDKGQPSLDAEACEESGDPVLAMYAERLSLGKIVEEHIPDLRKGTTTPIQASWDIAESGRVTCSKGRGGSTNGYQLTNPSRALELTCVRCTGSSCSTCGGRGFYTAKRDIRSCFVARPGYVLADADFSGLELSTVAQACVDLVGFSSLGDAINKGIDPHLQLGARMMGITYDDAKRRKHEKEVKHFRQLAKVANFGFPGGLGAKGFLAFARGYGVKTLEEDDAKRIKAEWLAAWPEFTSYFRLISAATEAAGVTEIVQLRSGRIRGLTPYTAACNTYFQGLGADGAKAALWEVTRRCYDPSLDSVLFGCRPVNFVHDQILAEVPEEYAHECAVELGRVMVEACNRYLPDVPVSCSPCLSRAWCKDAEAVFDQGGRMVPWDVARDARAAVRYADGQAVKW